MRQTLIGLSIFIGLQLAFAVVLLGVTMLESRQGLSPPAGSGSGPGASRRGAE